MSVSEATAQARLAQLQEAVAEAERRVAELEAEQRKAGRSVDRALAPLEDYYRALGAGEREEDPAVEGELIAAVKQAEDGITTRVVFNPHAEAHTRVELTSPRIDGLLAGARQALEQRRREVERFLRADFEQLAGELAQEAREAVEQFAGALPAIREADRRYRDAKRRWEPLIKAGLVDRAELPGYPHHRVDFDSLPPLPIPGSLVVEDGR